jgi:hypothetical protein
VTLFELIVVNNWTVTCDGFTAVTSKNSRWFFVAFHVVAVCVVNNMVVSVILDSFMADYNYRRDRRNSGIESFSQEGGVRIEADTATFDASSITNTTTKLKGKWVARVKGGVGGRRKSSFLRQVFTHSPERKVRNPKPEFVNRVEEGEEDEGEEHGVNDVEEPPSSSLRMSSFGLRSPANSLEGLRLEELSTLNAHLRSMSSGDGSLCEPMEEA